MSTRHLTMLTALAALTATTALAYPTPDPLRCQARATRCESDFYQCLARCDQRAPRASFPAGSRPVIADASCEAGCGARYDDGMARIDSASVCSLADPDPALCEARLLRSSAARLSCAARCGGRSTPPAAECLQRCDDRCRSGAAETAAGPICAAGRVGRSSLCGERP